MSLVNNAIITIMEKSVGERLCRSSPIPRTTNSTRPRVFTKTPTITDSRQLSTVARIQMALTNSLLAPGRTYNHQHLNE